MRKIIFTFVKVQNWRQPEPASIMQKSEKILIIGAGGQIGVELTENLSRTFGNENVIPSDLRDNGIFRRNKFEQLDALDKTALWNVVKEQGVTQVYHLAALLSATGEQNPMLAWKL